MTNGEEMDGKERRLRLGDTLGPRHPPLFFNAPGAAAIKYGSLFLDAPFHPDPALALAMTVGPPVAVALALAAAKD